jgi:hypothetical protein
MCLNENVEQGLDIISRNVFVRSNVKLDAKRHDNTREGSKLIYPAHNEVDGCLNILAKV